jgi:GTPase Era involved in 16S rRNA processing
METFSPRTRAISNRRWSIKEAMPKEIVTLGSDVGRVVLIRKTGQGKSSLINMISRYDNLPIIVKDPKKIKNNDTGELKTSDSGLPCTTDINEVGEKIIFVDTPGLDDSEQKDESTLEYFFTDVLNKPFNLIIIVVSLAENIQESYWKALKTYKDLFDEFPSKLRIAFSKAKHHDNEARYKNMKEMMQKEFQVESEPLIFSYPNQDEEDWEIELNMRATSLFNKWLNENDEVKPNLTMIKIPFMIKPKVVAFLAELVAYKKKIEQLLKGVTSRKKYKEEIDIIEKQLLTHNTNDFVIAIDSTHRIHHDSLFNKTHHFDLSCDHKISRFNIHTLREYNMLDYNVNNKVVHIIWKTTRTNDVWFNYTMLCCKRDVYHEEIIKWENRKQALHSILDSVELPDVDLDLQDRHLIQMNEKFNSFHQEVNKDRTTVQVLVDLCKIGFHVSNMLVGSPLSFLIM